VLFYYHLIDIYDLCCRKGYNPEGKHNLELNKDPGNQKRKRLGGDINNKKKCKVTHMDETLQMDFFVLSPPETCMSPNTLPVTLSSMLGESCISTEMIASSMDPTISPNPALFFLISNNMSEINEEIVYKVTNQSYCGYTCSRSYRR